MTIEVPEKPFIRLLFKWKGSVWQSVWKTLIIYLITYAIVNVTYRVALTQGQKEIFENVIAVIQHWTDVIPLQFILGFFVSYVIGNWWAMMCYLPYPDEFLYYVNIYINGQDEPSRRVRRTLARWCVLHVSLAFTGLCKKFKRRFPEDSYFVLNGLMTEAEYDLYNKTTSDYGKWFVPVWWASNLLARCHGEGLLSSEGLGQTSEKLWAVRSCCGWLKLYSWINVPLRYIQITTFAVYGYFVIALFTRQAVKERKADGTVVDIYVPFVLILEFIFYVGWLKVAEQNLNPFGKDDDDVSINYIMDKIHHVSFMLVDELNRHQPRETTTIFDGILHPKLRHTKASYPYRDHIPEDKFVVQLSDDEKTLLPLFDHFNEPPPVGYRSRLVSFANILNKDSGKVFSAEEMLKTFSNKVNDSTAPHASSDHRGWVLEHSC